jgi:hypothetical protein
LTALPERACSDGVFDSDFFEGVLLPGPRAAATAAAVQKGVAALDAPPRMPGPPPEFLHVAHLVDRRMMMQGHRGVTTSMTMRMTGAKMY